MKSISIAEWLPPYQTELGEAFEPYDSGYGNFTVSILGTTLAEFKAFVSALIMNNGTVYAENEIAGNLFGTYLFTDADGEEAVTHLMYHPVVGNARIVYGKRGFLPAYDEKIYSSGSVRTAVMQYARTAAYNSQQATGAAGMAYIITLADGSFIVIDGGPRQKDEHFTKVCVDGEWIDGTPGEEQDCDKLYRLITERAPKGEKPVIAAWFITHAHGDHSDVAGDFLRKYKDEVDVKIAAYNLSDPLIHPTKNERNDILSNTLHHIVEGFKIAGATHWDIHSGQRMSFPGCEVEILHTHEDYAPKPFAWCNHTSSAFRFRFKGKTFLVLGDCESDLCQLLACKYGDYLKSNILQVTHHGANGGSMALNMVVDPDICFWPIDAYRFHTDARMLGFRHGYEYNWVLRNNEIRQRIHYHTSEDAEIFTDEI